MLIASPTREIAIQTCGVLAEIGKHYVDVRCNYFIGGTSVQDDIQAISSCEIATGTPGRIKQLIDEGLTLCFSSLNIPGHLKTDQVKLFVVDEADQLFQMSFFDQIEHIYRMTLLFLLLKVNQELYQHESKS